MTSEDVMGNKKPLVEHGNTALVAAYLSKLSEPVGQKDSMSHDLPGK